MKRHRAIPLALIFVLAFFARARGERSIEDDVGPGVRASFKHKIVIEEETWPSALVDTRAGRALMELEARGGFQLHVRVRENPDDYVICVLYVVGDGRLVLDETTRFVFRYGDRVVESTEILLTDGPLEERVYTTREDTIVLTEHSPAYAKVKSGGYLTAVRFPEDSLPDGGEWVPDSFELRGGDCDEDVRS